uniref:F-box domain-containing protein n=1 Tax=Caenorhabditis tropicalis TaxID=1561998 RepID=A0A1I7TH88_9PELO
MIASAAKQVFEFIKFFILSFLHCLVMEYYRIVNFELDCLEIEVEKEEEVFPLFKLPLLAVENVFSMMTPFELIDLSLTSSKARRTVRSFSRLKPVRFWITLGISDEPTIEIEAQEETWTYTWTPYKMITFRSLFGNCQLSKTPMDDCIKWFEMMIKGVLACRVNKLSVSKLPPSITDWLRSEQKSIEEISIYGGVQKDLKYFLDHIKVTEEFLLDFPPENFHLEIPQSLTNLLIFHSKFINYDQLLRLKAPFIVLRQSILTSEEINRFLKSWMSSESHVELDTFEINIRDWRTRFDIIELPGKVEADPKSKKEMKKKFPGIEMESEFNVTRTDGKTATVCIGQGLFDYYRLCMMTHWLEEDD